MYYTVENHLKHFGEAKAGEPLYVTAQILGVDDKRLHVFQRMHRARDDKQIATAEQLYLHVDTAAARAAPADPKTRSKLESIRGEHARLPLPPESGRAVAPAKR
jgi:carnitine 3-dehydrogenase